MKMARTDTLSGTVQARAQISLVVTEDEMASTEVVDHNPKATITDGSGTDQATAYLHGTVAVTTGGVTISLADDADPFGSGGDTSWTSDPEGMQLITLLIENEDDTNYITVGQGTNGLAGFLSGATDTIRIDPGGFLLWHCPPGATAMNDGSDDELDLTANTATCNVTITALAG